MKKYKFHDTLSINFDFHKLSRWLIKIAYNYARASKEGTKWFLNNMDYILEKTYYHDNFSILAGINIDMSPLGEENGLYLPLCINSNLKFYESGCIPHETMVFGIKSNNEVNPLNLNAIYKSYSFRFGSARFILILWKKSFSVDEINNEIKLIDSLFPYKNILSPNFILEKVNDAFLSNYSNIIIGNLGLSISDSRLFSLVPDFEKSRDYIRKINSELKINVEQLVISNYNNKNPMK